MKKILLVEDDDINVDVISSYLASKYEFDVARTGASAIEYLTQNTYDLFVIDIHLGKSMNGLQLTEYIRSNPFYKITPIIIITAYTMRGEREASFAKGCTDYLEKPFLKNTLLNLVEKYI